MDEQASIALLPRRGELRVPILGISFVCTDSVLLKYKKWLDEHLQPASWNVADDDNMRSVMQWQIMAGVS